jgi:hypothetical protein
VVFESACMLRIRKTQALNLTICSEAMQIMMMLFGVLVRASGLHSWLGA